MSSTIFQSRAASAVGPASQFVPVTPDDAANLPKGVTRGLFVGAAGDVTVSDAAGNVATFSSGDSQYHPLSVAKVHATGTTATGVVALY